jgi:hypothetical protein
MRKVLNWFNPKPTENIKDQGKVNNVGKQQVDDYISNKITEIKPKCIAI